MYPMINREGGRVARPNERVEVPSPGRERETAGYNAVRNEGGVQLFDRRPATSLFVR